MWACFTKAVREALREKLLELILLREAGPSSWDIPVEYWRSDIGRFDFSSVIESIGMILAGASGGKREYAAPEAQATSYQQVRAQSM